MLSWVEDDGINNEYVYKVRGRFYNIVCIYIKKLKYIIKLSRPITEKYIG